MPFRIRHPDDDTVRATYYPERGGIFLDIVGGGATASWDAADLGEDPMVGALVVLVTFGFVGGDDVDDALVWLDSRKSHRQTFLPAPPPGWPGRRRPRRGVRGVLRIIRELERAAGG